MCKYYTHSTFPLEGKTDPGREILCQKIKDSKYEVILDYFLSIEFGQKIICINSIFHFNALYSDYLL